MKLHDKNYVDIKIFQVLMKNIWTFLPKKANILPHWIQPRSVCWCWPLFISL